MLSRFLPRETFDSYDDFKRNFSIRTPKHFNFAFDVVDARAAATPDRTAMVWCNDRGAVHTFTFADMKRQSDRVASLFIAWGIGKGDPVMLILKRRYEFWFCLLGLHKIGAVAIPATHLLRAKDLIYRNRAADIRMIVCVPDAGIVEQVEESEPQSPSLRNKAILGGYRAGWIDFDAALEGAPDRFVPSTGDAAPANDDASLIYFTSGTTGMPKMVRHDFAYPLGHIITSRYWQNVRDGGLHMTVADTGWAKAVWGKIYGQWLVGAGVFVYDYDKFVPRDLLGAISRHKVTSFCAPPTIFRYLIKEDLASFDLSALEYCTVAGEPLNPEVYNRWLEATGLRLMEGYGQTETVVQIATWPWMEPRPGSMGKPAPGYDIDVVDDKGNSCEPGAEGQIVIRTAAGRPPGMFRGYYRDAELTEEVWHDGIYHTGDMAWRDEDDYFWFVGRADDVIKSSGYRIGPFEVESALLEHPAVLECAITAVPDPDRGQVVKATVVPTAGHRPGPELVKELQEHVKRVTAPYKYPRVIEFVGELPKTISGKIRRVEIRDRDKDV